MTRKLTPREEFESWDVEAFWAEQQPVPKNQPKSWRVFWICCGLAIMLAVVWWRSA